MNMRQGDIRTYVKQCLTALCVFIPIAGLSIQAAQADKPKAAQMLSDFDTAILYEHNQERVSLGLKPLIWDAGLAQDAARWANRLSKLNQFEHAYAELAKNGQGENLWMGSIGAYKPKEMVGMWIEERQYAKPGVFPDISKTGNWADIGHYSQLIWPSTQKVGCALSTGQEDDVLVCRYFPAGNEIGTKFSIARTR